MLGLNRFENQFPPDEVVAAGKGAGDFIGLSLRSCHNTDMIYS
jgi:hypothetical protein